MTHSPLPHNPYVNLFPADITFSAKATLAVPRGATHQPPSTGTRLSRPSVGDDGTQIRATERSLASASSDEGTPTMAPQGIPIDPDDARHFDPLQRSTLPAKPTPRHRGGRHRAATSASVFLEYLPDHLRHAADVEAFLPFPHRLVDLKVRDARGGSGRVVAFATYDTNDVARNAVAVLRASPLCRCGGVLAHLSHAKSKTCHSGGG